MTYKVIQNYKNDSSVEIRSSYTMLGDAYISIKSDDDGVIFSHHMNGRQAIEMAHALLDAVIEIQKGCSE